MRSQAKACMDSYSYLSVLKDWRGVLEYSMSFATTEAKASSSENEIHGVADYGDLKKVSWTILLEKHERI